MLIGATVVTLFLGETLAPRSESVVPWSFLGGIVCFVLALVCFLAETLLASHTLRFAKQPPQYRAASTNSPRNAGRAGPAVTPL